MLRSLNKVSSGKRILGTWNVGIDSSIISSETATGDNGAGLLYDDSLLGSNAGKELRVHITNYTGSPSALFVYENGAIEIIGESNGSYTISYDVYADNVLVAADTASISVGEASISVIADGGIALVVITTTGGVAEGGVSAYALGGTGIITITTTGGRASTNGTQNIFIKQELGYISVSSTWIKVQGTWVESIAYIKQNGSWISP